MTRVLISVALMGFLAAGEGCAQPPPRDPEGYFNCIENRETHAGDMAGPNGNSLRCRTCGERFDGRGKNEGNICPGGRVSRK